MEDELIQKIALAHNDIDVASELAYLVRSAFFRGDLNATEINEIYRISGDWIEKLGNQSSEEDIQAFKDSRNHLETIFNKNGMNIAELV